MEHSSREIGVAPTRTNLPETGRNRVVIEGVSPEVDCGQFPIKRIVNDRVVVEADIFTDGHDAVSADLLYRFEHDTSWERVAFKALVNDRWQAEFPVTQLGRYRYTIVAWVDHLKSWRRDFDARVAAGQQSLIDIKIGAGYIAEHAQRAAGADAEALSRWARELSEADDSDAATETATDD